MSGGGYDVFLSYSRADSAAADTLRARLKEAGLRTGATIIESGPVVQGHATL